MSKQKKSKLDPYAERLTQWFTPKDRGGDGFTIAEAQAQLKLDGCSVSSGRLSEWWEARQQELTQAKLLNQISVGAGQCKEVEEMFGKNPPPETETLIKLVRVLIMKFSTEANVSPQMSELVFNMLKPVIKWSELAIKKEALALDQKKFQRETCELFVTWSADQKARDLAGSNLSYADKIEKLGQTMFGESWK